MKGNLKVSYTALLVLYLRKLYSPKESLAYRMAVKLDAENEVPQAAADFITRKYGRCDQEKYDQLMFIINSMAPLIELRTKAIRAVADRFGFNCNVGLGAGLNPYGIELVAGNPAACYYHTDLSNTILAQLGECLEDIHLENPYFYLRHLDVLSENQFMEIANALQGKKVLLDSTGLLQYLKYGGKDSPKYRFFKNLSAAMQSLHGDSVFATVDIGFLEDLLPLREQYPELLIAREFIQDMSGEDIEANCFPGQASFEQMLNSCGLKVEIKFQSEFVNINGLVSSRAVQLSDMLANLLPTRKIFLISRA